MVVRTMDVYGLEYAMWACREQLPGTRVWTLLVSRQPVSVGFRDASLSGRVVREWGIGIDLISTTDLAQKDVLYRFSSIWHQDGTLSRATFTYLGKSFKGVKSLVKTDIVPMLSLLWERNKLDILLNEGLSATFPTFTALLGKYLKDNRMSHNQVEYDLVIK